MKTVAPARNGLKKLLHACLPQPGELMLRCTSPGLTPSQYIVDRCPIGYDTWLWRTSFGCDVVPEVKYSSDSESAGVGASGSNVDAAAALAS